MENQENDRNPIRQDSGAQNPNDLAHDQSSKGDDQNPTNYHQGNAQQNQQGNQGMSNKVDMDQSGRMREGVNNNAGLNDSPHGDNYNNETGDSAGIENRNQAQQEYQQRNEQGNQSQGDQSGNQEDRERREENREDGHSTII